MLFFSQRQLRSAKETNAACIIGCRPIMVNEIFQIRLNEIDIKWLDSIELGVTSKLPKITEMPASLKELKFCWVFSGCSITYNCQTFISDYGHIDTDCLNVRI